MKNYRTIDPIILNIGPIIPTTEEADEILHKMGVHIVPDFIANQESICYLTSIQNAKCEPTPEGVMDRLSDVIRRGVDKKFQQNFLYQIYKKYTNFRIVMRLFSGIFL